MTEPARVTAAYPGGPAGADVRVALRCSCESITDLTWKAGLPPGVVECAGCGARLELPPDLAALTPEQAGRWWSRRSLRAAAAELAGPGRTGAGNG